MTSKLIRTATQPQRPLHNRDTYLIIGAKDDASAPRIGSLGFMAPNLTASSQLEDMNAACILTEYPWQPQYGAHYWLHTGRGR